MAGAATLRGKPNSPKRRAIQNPSDVRAVIPSACSEEPSPETVVKDGRSPVTFRHEMKRAIRGSARMAGNNFSTYDAQDQRSGVRGQPRDHRSVAPPRRGRWCFRNGSSINRTADLWFRSGAAPGTGAQSSVEPTTG